MELLTLIFSVIPLVASITISSNGNSPEIKMIGGMMVDVQKGFTPMMPKLVEATTKANVKKRKLNSNSTKLSINERYRRLIPYMTFYYANDLVSPPTEGAKNVEVEKAEIIEAKTITHQQSEHRQPKKIYYNTNRNIPLYQGNRLTQYNIASANPTKYFYKGVVPTPQSIRTTNYNPLLSDHRGVPNNDFEYERIVQKPIFKAPSVPFSAPTRKPYLNLYENDDTANVRYYIPEKEQAPKFKLVPYEQTPPIKVEYQNENIYQITKPLASVPGHPPKEQVYIKPRPARPSYIYDNSNVPETPIARKPPSIVSESYYEKRRPYNPIVQPVIESGFRPIVSTPVHSTESTLYESNLQEAPIHHQFDSQKTQKVQVLDGPAETPEEGVLNPNYFHYLGDQPSYKPSYVQSNTVTLADLLNSLQLNKSIPKPITRENVGASIITLLQVLNALKALPKENEAEPVLATPTPLIENKVVAITTKPEESVTPISVVTEDPDFHDEPYLAPVNTPSQHIDDFSPSLSSSQRFPLPITSDDEGGTPGRPGVDYPILTTIPQTAFNCKTQRYKGFFADPETRCQVWHYCDLNGGQASFLCPNGTIFSQAGLTCDWWFNVRCSSTAQLYVLNESLYKYILPHSPKFPEDYSGPLVDKYLTLKFKEMEEQFKKNKHKTAEEKMDSDEMESSTEESSDGETSSEQTELDKTVVSEASVIVGSPGTSGNVERLQD